MQMAFWDSFSECSRALNPYADGNDPAETIEKSARWHALFEFICRSCVFVDSPLQKLGEIAQSDPMLKTLLKRNADGLFNLEYQEGSFPDLESHQGFEFDDDYSSLFLTKNDLRKAAREHGVINICSTTIWNQQDKFKDTGEVIETDKGFAWNKMEILRENSNGMVIIDNFLLAPDKKTRRCTIRYDLRELFRLMLPDTSIGDYVVSIFYYDDSDNREENRKQFFQNINDFLKAKKKSLSVKLELFPTTFNGQNYHKDFHDRTIITNNIWVGSEAGFDLLVQDFTTNTNTRAIKTTKTHGLYLGFGNDVAKWLDKAYDNLIEEAKRCLKKYKYKTENRLLL